MGDVLMARKKVGVVFFGGQRVPKVSVVLPQDG